MGDATAIPDRIADQSDFTSGSTGHAIFQTAGGFQARAILQADVSGLVADLGAKAPLASPTFTGVPTAPTAAQGTNTTQLATTAFTRAEIAALVNSAPGVLDTLGEIAAALQADESTAAALATTVAAKASRTDLPYYEASFWNIHASNTASVNATSMAAVMAAFASAGGGTLSINVPGTYLFGGAGYAVFPTPIISIPAKVRIVCGPGVTLKLADSSNTYFVANATQTGGGTSYINIEGGTWDFNRAGQTIGVPTANVGQWLGFGMLFRNTPNLHLDRMTTTGARSYAIWVTNNSTGGLIENCDFQDCFSDALHFGGPVKKFTVRNCKGTTGDDFMGWTIGDYVGYEFTSDVRGDFEDILIENLNFVGCYAGIGLLGASGEGSGPPASSGLAARRFTVRGLTGSVTNSVFRVKDDYVASGNVLRGMIAKGIVVENVDVTIASANPMLEFSLTGGGSISYDNINYLPSSTGAALKVGGPATKITLKNLKSLTACANVLISITGAITTFAGEDWTALSTGGGKTIEIYAGGAIAQGVISKWDDYGAGYSISTDNDAGSVFLTLDGCRFKDKTNAFRISSTFDINLSGSTVFDSNTFITNRANASTVLTIRGEGGIRYVGSVAHTGSTGTFNVNHPELRCDTSTINAPATYDLAHDTTNGPVVYTGSAWVVRNRSFGLISGKLSQFAATTSSELAGVISDETGSGAVVFANTPLLVTPILGTPTSGTLTNCTIPRTAITGLGTNIATFLGAAFPDSLQNINVGVGAAHGFGGSYNGSATTEGFDLFYTNAGSTTVVVASRYDNGAAQMRFRMRTAGTPIDALIITGLGSSVFGAAALATSATDGFVYIPTGAGPPTGTPSSFTGMAPLYFDSTNKQLWIYISGWKPLGDSAPVTLTDAATVAIDASKGNSFRVTVTASRTIGNPTNATDGRKYLLEILQNGTGGFTPTFDTSWSNVSGATIASNTANKRTWVSFIYNSVASKFYILGFLNEP